MRIGILRESSPYRDPRVAITPKDAGLIEDRFPGTKCLVQPCDFRAFKDEEYTRNGITVTEDLSECDLLFGVKEVSIESMMKGKTYCFFAHVAKQQPYHKNYFKKLAAKKITLLDYEFFKDEKGNRLTAFGYWAGIVGAMYTFEAIGKKYGLFDSSLNFRFESLSQMQELFRSMHFPPVKILLSGNGHTAKGVIEVLEKMNIKRISPDDFQKYDNTEAVYCQLKSKDYLFNQNGKHYDRLEMNKNPESFSSTFSKYIKHANVYIACHFWKQGYPTYIRKNDLPRLNNLLVIADISCDLNGPIATSVMESTHEKPFYDFHREKLETMTAFSDTKSITCMTVGNLPAALPGEASLNFSKALFDTVIPELLNAENSRLIEKARILKNGELTPDFLFLDEFLNT